MKTLNRTALLALAASSVAIAAQQSLAVSGTWTNASGGLWGASGNWSNSDIADGAGFTADFSTLNISAIRTVNLDSSRTIGHLKFADTASTFFAWTLANNGNSSNILTLDGDGSTPTITAAAGGTPSATISLELAGTNGFRKLGTGTLQLTGANTITGGISVAAGTLQIGNGTAGSIASQNLTFADTATVNFNRAANATQSMGTLSFLNGAGTVQSTYAGSGTNTLSFSSISRTANMTGNLVTSGGTTSTNLIKLTDTSVSFLDRGVFLNGLYAYRDASSDVIRAINWNVDSGATSVAGGSSIASTTFAQTTAAVSAQDNATFTGLNIVNAANSAQAFTLGAGKTVTTNGILRSGNGGSSSTTTISGGTAIRAGTDTELVIRTDASNDLLTISTPILANGTNALVKTGAGTLTLNAANTFSGGTFIRQGTVVASNASAFGPSSSSVTLGGGTMRPGSLTIANPINVVAASSITQSDGATSTLNGLITIDSGNNLVFNLGSGTMNVSGGVTGAGSLQVDGNGTTVLNTTNSTYTGTTVVRRSRLSVGATGALGTGELQLSISNDASGSLTSSNSTPRTVSNAVTINGQNGNSVLTLGSATTGDLTFTGPVTLGPAQATQIITLANTTTMSGVVTGASGITMRVPSTGALVLSNTNTYTGVTNIAAGRLDASVLAVGGADSSIGKSTNAATSLILGGTLKFVGTTSGTTDRLFTMNSAAPTLDASGSVPMQFTNTGSLVTANPASQLVTVSGSAIPSGTTSLTVQNGSLLSIGMAIVNSTYLPANTTITGISGNTVTLSAGTIASMPTFNSQTFTFAGGPRTLTLTGSNADANSLASIIVDPTGANGSQNNKTAVAKSGSGTWSISAANSYTGGTTVSAGTLLVNNLTGSGTGTGAVTVNGGTLGGGGIISGDVVVTAGTLAPGNSPGKLTVGSLSLASGTTTAMEIGGIAQDTQYDNLTASAALTYGGTLNIAAINGYDLAQEGTYDLFDYGTTVGGGFASVTVNAFSLTGASGVWTGTSGTTTYTFTESTGVLAVAVPEPATLSVFGLLGTVLLRRRRA